MEERIKELIEKLNKASAAYYNGETESPLSDKEWDAMYDELSRLEKETGIIFPDSPTQKAGSEATSALQKVKHEFPALSLDKTKDVKLIASKIAKGVKESNKTARDAIIMWKADGMTIQATYDKGSLVRAVTRGNGYVGEDVTHNAPYINGLPLTVPVKGKFTVRGEAMISYAEFERINEDLPDDEKYKNPRNLVSGTVRLDDSSVNKGMKGRKVDFFAFKVVDEFAAHRMTEQFYELKMLGFQVIPFEAIHEGQDIETVISEWSETSVIEGFGFPVDGLVLAINDTYYADGLPGTGHNPHVYSGYALKWADETEETILRDIEWSASRTGLLNPVAVFDPVELEGTTVARASIHNLSYIMDKDLRIGDTITVYKANKIIPQIDKDLSAEKRNLKVKVSKDYINLEKCPICGEPLSIHSSEDGEVLTLFCNNPSCPAKQIGKFVHFCERDCMNIEGMSEATITTFVNHGFLKEFSDFFHLGRYEAEIKALDGFGDKSYENILKAVEKARKTDTVSFLHACGIPNIGKGQAKLLCPAIIKWRNKNPQGETVSSQENLIDALAAMVWDGYDFTEIDGFGDVLAKSITEWTDSNIVDVYCRYAPDTEITTLLKEVEFTDVYTDYVKDTSDSPLSGKIFVVTGDVHYFKNRNELQAKIEELGGKVSGSVSKNTSYLINNDVTSTSGKNQKAKELGIPIISEDEFIQMIS